MVNVTGNRLGEEPRSGPTALVGLDQHRAVDSHTWHQGNRLGISRSASVSVLASERVSRGSEQLEYILDAATANHSHRIDLCQK